MRRTQFTDYEANFYKRGVVLTDSLFDIEPEEEQTFTRRQKRLYEQATGQQRAETKERVIKKRKARTLGEEKQARSTSRHTTRTRQRVR